MVKIKRLEYFYVPKTSLPKESDLKEDYTRKYLAIAYLLNLKNKV